MISPELGKIQMDLASHTTFLGCHLDKKLYCETHLREMSERQLKYSDNAGVFLVKIGD